MELIFQSTKAFEKDLRRLSPSDRSRLAEQVNKYAQLFLRDRRAFFMQSRRPYHIKLLQGFDSSLFSLRISAKIRVIISIDEDPLFEQTIVTLFRIAKSPSGLPKIFASVAESLYQSQLEELSPMGFDNDSD